jgi:hypothetical protein
MVSGNNLEINIGRTKTTNRVCKIGYHYDTTSTNCAFEISLWGADRKYMFYPNRAEFVNPVYAPNIYPVNSIYKWASTTNPGATLGGTWTMVGFEGFGSNTFAANSVSNNTECYSTLDVSGTHARATGTLHTTAGSNQPWNNFWGVVCRDYTNYTMRMIRSIETNVIQPAWNPEGQINDLGGAWMYYQPNNGTGQWPMLIMEKSMSIAEVAACYAKIITYSSYTVTSTEWKRTA